MNRFFVLLLFLFVGSTCFSQSLGKTRVNRLNKSVVRISINNIPRGSGFFVSNDGWLASNRHVINNALLRDSTGIIRGILPIHAEFNNGERVKLGIMTYLLQEGNDESEAYDYVLLKPTEPFKSSFEPLKLGTWQDVSEGDVIYTCGFPFGIKQRIISQGLFSTKWQEIRSVGYPSDTIPLRNFKRNSAYLDLTTNKGNSGGPIIKLGDTPEEDVVIGIATFILSPYAKIAEDGAKFYNDLYVKNKEKGITETKQRAIIFSSLANNSIGVSGTVSIDYLRLTLQQLSPR